MATSTRKAPMPNPRPGNILLTFAFLFMSGAYLQASNLAQGSLLGKPEPPDDITEQRKEVCRST